MNKIEIYTLWIQRSEAYEGQRAPECLLAWDEYTVEESPATFEEACKHELQGCGDDVVGDAVIRIEVDLDLIHERLTSTLKIEGKVLP